MISAFDPFGQLKAISDDDVVAGGEVFASLARRIDESPADPYGVTFALWVTLMQLLIDAGLPPRLLINNAIQVAAQHGCAGSA